MDPIIVTLGVRRYRVQRPWPGPEHDFRAICDVTVLSDGRIAAMRRRAPELMIFSPEGELLGEWDIPGLVCPHYLHSSPDGGALIADFDGHQIIAVDRNGKVSWKLGDPLRPNWMAPFNHPTAACLDTKGNLYVTDGYGNSCLHRFDADRRLAYTVGSQGKALGEFTTPHDVLQIRDGRLLVVDRENNRLKFYNVDGEALGEIGDLYKPMALAELPDGTLLATDHTPRLSRFGPDGTLLGRCRTFSTVAHGMGASADGHIYLAEMTPDTLTRLAPIA